MTRYTFDPRPDWKPRKSQRDMQIGIVDTMGQFMQLRAAKIIGPVEHAEAVRAAAKAYCDTLNQTHGAKP